MELSSVVLDGHVLPGFDWMRVQTGLTRLLKLSEELVGKLIAGTETTIESGLDAISGDRYLTALKRLGVACRVVPQTLETDAGLAEALGQSSAELKRSLSPTPADPLCRFEIHCRHRLRVESLSLERSAPPAHLQIRIGKQ